MICIQEGHEWKITFSTVYFVMPYGLANAPSVFQAFVNEVFWDMLGRQVVMYIADILLYSATLEEHIAHDRVVLGRLMENHLNFKAEKCLFQQAAVSFFGYRLSLQGVVMEERKVPVPTIIKGLQRFVGLFQRVNVVTYRLHLPINYRISPSFNVSFLR